MKKTIKDLEQIFFKQFGDLSCGGFLNPTIENETDEYIYFRCFYDNYDNKNDSWNYEYNKKTEQFV